jgi:cold-inducible RNA-binding protein
MVGNSREKVVSEKLKSSMNTKLFVGNLSFNTTQNQLQDLFAVHGNVIEVDVIMDKFSGRPRGFGFVTMESKEAAEAAIQGLNGKQVDGRAMTVNEARPREERAPRSGGGGGGDRGRRGEHSGYRG